MKIAAKVQEFCYFTPAIIAYGIFDADNNEAMVER